MSDNHYNSTEDKISNPAGWLAKKCNSTKIAWALLVICVFLLIADFAIHRHAEIGIDGYIGFYGAYGLIGSIFLVFLAKQMCKLLKRPEDYYDD